MMRIALFADTYRWGGAERVLASTAQAALAAGHEVLVLSPQPWLLDRLAAGHPAPRCESISGSLALRSLPGRPGKGLLLMSQLLELRARLTTLRPTVLHVSNGGYPGSLLCCLAVAAAPKRSAQATILSVHATPRPRVLAGLERSLDAAVWRHAGLVAVATDFVGNRLSELRGMPSSGCVKVPYGVAKPGGADRRSVVRRRFGVQDGQLLAGMISAGSETEKGHAVLIEALARSPATVRAVIAGAPLPPVASKKIAELCLEDRVVVAGHVDDIDPVYHALELLVLPSVADEGLPLVILEAMAAGRPVLASRISGIPEAVLDGETGRLLDPGSVDALTDALTEAAVQPNRLRGWGEAATARWAANYSPAAMSAATLALYERVAAIAGQLDTASA
jgi:glycosyltransferase involved in cell wall biosynthesis